MFKGWRIPFLEVDFFRELLYLCQAHICAEIFFSKPALPSRLSSCPHTPPIALGVAWLTVNSCLKFRPAAAVRFTLTDHPQPRPAPRCVLVSSFSPLLLLSYFGKARGSRRVVDGLNSVSSFLTLLSDFKACRLGLESVQNCVSSVSGNFPAHFFLSGSEPESWMGGDKTRPVLIFAKNSWPHLSSTQLGLAQFGFAEKKSHPGKEKLSVGAAR